MACLVDFGLAPYFHKEFVSEISSNSFVLCIDEALNRVVQKGQIIHYLIEKSQELKVLKENKGLSLLNIGSCSLHMIYRAFQRDNKKSNWRLNETFSAMYRIFKGNSNKKLSRSIAAAKTATASVGRFQEKLPKEKNPKKLMKKRKFKPNLETKTEKENNLKILEELNKKKPKLDVAEAVQRYMTKPLKEKSDEKSAVAARKKSAKKNKFKKNLYRSGNKKGGFKKHTK